MKEILDQIGSAWNALSARQRLSLVISAALTVAAVGSIAWWARQPSWTVLYTGLDGKEAQEIVQELQSNNVSLRLRDGGTTIEVPYEQLDEVRIDLASKSLPQSGRFGFIEMFQGDNFAQSNRMHQVRLQKALEDELARTVESLDEVHSARVHLVMTGERVFLDDDDTAKASVTLSLTRGRKLAPEHVQAIARIVAGAVPELGVEHVSVVDTAGHVLWDGGGEAGGSGLLAARQVEMQNAIEDDINRKVSRVLGPLVGEDRFVVRTTAELDLKRSVWSEKQFDPDSGVLVSEQKSKKKSSRSSSGGAGGVPGTGSNLPGGAGGSTGRGNAEQETQQTNNYQYSMVERQVEEPTGKIERLSVAVLVDQSWPAAAEDGQKGEPQARSDEEMARIEQLVKAAISFDEARGDVVTIDQTPFRTTEIEPVEPALDPRPWLPLVKYPALILLLLLAFLLFFRPMMRTLSTALVPAAGHGQGGRAGAGARIDQPGQLGPPSQLEMMRQRLSSLASEQPEGMAQTMRVWLHESEE